MIEHQIKIVVAVILVQIAIFLSPQLWAVIPITIALFLMVSAFLDISFIRIGKYKIGK